MRTRSSFIAGAIAAALLSPAFGSDKLMGPPVVAPQGQELANITAKLNHDIGLSPEHGLRLASAHPGTMGTRILRFDHTYQGLRILNSQSVVTTNAGGEILSRSGADLRGALAGRSARLNVTPLLSPGEAIDRAIALAPPNAIHTQAPGTELIVYPMVSTLRTPAAGTKRVSAMNAVDFQNLVTGHQLAYLVRTRMQADGRTEAWDTVVGAASGRILARISTKHDVAGTGYSQYSGTVPLATTFDGTKYLMLDPTRGTGGVYGGNAVLNFDNGHAGGPVYASVSNVWGDGQQYVPGGSTSSANGQTAAVNAMWGMANTYDTLNKALGWQSLDGNNTATYIGVHYGSGEENAYFEDACNCMYIGDGSTTFTNFGSVDIIGHEFGHGVTHATSRLNGSDESFGLNESFSDITGEMVEAFARGGGNGTVIPAAGNDWVIGQEITRSGQPLRWMAKPSKDGLSPDAWFEGIGGADPHLTAGPHNRMFYFLSQGSNATAGNDAYSPYLSRLPRAMTGIGNDSAYRIVFHANTTQFTSATNYADARAKMITSAQQLFGAGSKEEIAVKRAYAAVNVGMDTDEIGYTTPIFILTPPANAAVNVGRTASFSVVPEAGKAPFYYLWYKNGARVRAATGPSYAFKTTASDNNAGIYVIVTDSSAVPTSARSSTARLTVNPVGTLYERMVNGDFEQGATGWSGLRESIGTWEPYQGVASSWLGGAGQAVTQFVYQTVAIPAESTVATLSFALRIVTDEPATGARDVMTVSVRDSTGRLLGTLATYSNLDAGPYVVRKFDVSAYRGQTVQLHFSETENAGVPTSFYLDTVSLKTD